jgi:hypothetical protein
MKQTFTLTLCALLTISCAIAIGCSTATYQVKSLTKGATMTYGVGTQSELDEGNRRITAFKDELLHQGFRQVSVSDSNTKDEFVLEGLHGTLRDLRVTLWTGKTLLTDAPELGGGIQAFVKDEQADREFEELYQKVVVVVTGQH